MTSVNQKLIIRHLGRQPYLPVWEKMQLFTEQRTMQTIDEIWLLEHERVFTQGRAGKNEHLLAPGDIPVVAVDRGGQVTYHGPGQLVGYLMVDLKRRRLAVRALVQGIEAALSSALARHGIQAATKAGAPGVYIGPAKIASLGLRIKHGCSFHGLALNIDMDLEPFARINPCGFQGLQMTQVRDHAGDISFQEIEQELALQLQKKLGYGLVSSRQGWT